MLREKSHINPNKYNIKLGFYPKPADPYSSKQRKPMGNPPKNSKNCPYGKDIMEMCYYIISIVQGNIHG
jgi:hypothetical protein